MRESLEFETHAVNVFGVFDDVITNLENVDVALSEIHSAGQSSIVSSTLVQVGMTCSIIIFTPISWVYLCNFENTTQYF